MTLHQPELFPECKKPLSKDEGFELFWNAYPRKIGTAINGSKFKARQAWDKAAKRNDWPGVEIVTHSALLYRQWADAEQKRIDREAERKCQGRDWPEPKPAAVCHAATWLNQRRWESD